MKHLPILYFIVLFIPLSGYSQNTLTFTHDNAGNQMLRDFKNTDRTAATAQQQKEATTFEDELTNMSQEEIENFFEISPNPTSGRAVLSWKPEIAEQITNIELVSLVTSERKEIAISNKNTVQIDLTGKVTGLYIVIFHLKNTEIAEVQKKLLKM